MAQTLECGIGVCLFFSLCAVTVLIGRGLLRLLRLETLPRAGLLLAPVVALVFWSLSLGVAGALRVPTRAVTPWLWAASGLLAVSGLRRLGAALRPAGPLLL